MPWKVVKDTAACSVTNPFAVKVKLASGGLGRVVGCHRTQAEADRQLAALYANVPEGREGG